MALGIDPIMIDPTDDTGAVVADGTYGLAVADGMVQGLTPPHELPAGGSVGDVLTKVSGADYAATWAAPAGGGGGGGTTVRDRRWLAGSDEATVDEFNDDSLNAAWTRVDATSGSARATWTESADVLSVLNAGGDASAEMHALVRSIGTGLAVGDGFVIALTIGSTVGSNYAYGGLLLADGITYGSGSQLAATSHVGTTSADHYVRSMTGYNNFAASSDQYAGGVIRGVPFFVRVSMRAANTWRRDISYDGVSWLVGANVSRTLTPTYVGVLSSSSGTSTRSTVSYEFIRRVADVV